MLGDNFPQLNNEIPDENLAQEAIKIDAYSHIKEAIKKYGLEGTEDKIKEIYSNNPKIREIMLKTLYAIWKG